VQSIHIARSNSLNSHEALP